jgi:plasmid maintenance system killer protein
MVINYKTRKLEKSLTEARDLLKTYGNRAQKVNQRLKEIKASTNLKVLNAIPAANCHPLRGSRSGEYAVDISPNWRMIFIIDLNPIPLNDDGTINLENVTEIKITSVEDYH